MWWCLKIKKNKKVISGSTRFFFKYVLCGKKKIEKREQL